MLEGVKVYGSYPVALSDVRERASERACSSSNSTRTNPRDFADVFQTRSRDQVQWPVAVKKRSRTRAALFAVIDDAYVRAFVKQRYGRTAILGRDPFKV